MYIIIFHRSNSQIMLRILNERKKNSLQIGVNIFFPQKKKQNQFEEVWKSNSLQFSYHRIDRNVYREQIRKKSADKHQLYKLIHGINERNRETEKSRCWYAEKKKTGEITWRVKLLGNFEQNDSYFCPYRELQKQMSDKLNYV